MSLSLLTHLKLLARLPDNHVSSQRQLTLNALQFSQSTIGRAREMGYITGAAHCQNARRSIAVSSGSFHAFAAPTEFLWITLGAFDQISVGPPCRRQPFLHQPLGSLRVGSIRPRGRSLLAEPRSLPKTPSLGDGARVAGVINLNENLELALEALLTSSKQGVQRAELSISPHHNS